MATYYLQKTLTTNGNSFGFSCTDYQIDLDSSVKDVKEIFSIKDIFIERPHAKSSRNSYSSNTIIIPLKKVEWTFTVTGGLTNDDGNMTTITQNGNAVANTAVNKKNVLIAMAEQGGTVLFGHRNFGANRPVDANHPDNKSATAETVVIKSMEFPDVETEVGSDETTIMKPNEERLTFTIVLRKGSERGT